MTSEDAYRLFFTTHPGQKNPTDLNTREKYEFMREVGYELFREMQCDRKRSEPWTKETS